VLASSVSPPFRRVAGGTFKHSLWVLGLRLLEANIRPQGRPRQRLLVLSRSVTTIATAAISCPRSHRVTPTVLLQCHASGVAHRAFYGRISVCESITHLVVIATVRLHLAVQSLRLLNSKQSRAFTHTGLPPRFSRALSPLASHISVTRARYSFHEHNGAGRHPQRLLVLGRSVMFFAVFSPYGRKMQKNIPSLSVGHSHCSHEH